MFMLLSVAVQAQRDYEKYAKTFLTEHCQYNPYSMRVVKETDDFVVLTSTKKPSFVILARDKYDDILPNPVLAYSTESAIYPDKDGVVDGDIFAYYTQVLHQLRKDSVTYNGYEGFTGEKRLKTVVFGQQKFDMLIIGERGMRVAGCVPTAATQMMYYHKWPEYTHGKYLFYRPDDNGYVFRINVEGMHLNWPTDCSIYNSTTRRLIAPDRFLAINGLLFEADFGLERTSANMQFCKRSFVTHYGYSRKMIFCNNQEEGKMLRALRSELDVDRPVMVGRWGHAFIIDGYDSDFFHFNLGWYGYHDGYYRIFPEIGRQSEHDSWEMILGIMPEHKEQFTEKTVTLTQPGTLSDYITAEDYDNLGSLKVIGPINGKDIRLLRDLSGGAKVDVPIEKRGVLSSLDLSAASIVASKDVYNEYWEFSDEHKKYTDCHEWSDCWQEEVIPHKAYVTRMFTIKNQIGLDMFCECDGLETIILPTNVTHIGWEAFGECTMLRSITIPPSVKYVKDNIFRRCKSLLEIHCDRNASFVKCDTTATDTTFTHPFKGLYPYTSVIPE